MDPPVADRSGRHSHFHFKFIEIYARREFLRSL
jgi:hypothetical protein